MHLKSLLATSGIALLGAQFTSALDADGWRNQSIYQLLTDRFSRDDSLNAPCDLVARQYCGGTWRGIIDKLDYIQGMGFTAIWISPVSANLPEGYHGYYTTDFYQTNPRFGSTQDLKDLSAALHRRGMYLMLDVIANHVAVPQRTPFRPTDGTWGVFNRDEDFHKLLWCRNYENQSEVEQCWLGELGEIALPDLNTESPKVVAELQRIVHWLVREFSVDGLRVDTLKHVRKTFWPDYERAAGVWCTGEVLHGDPSYTLPYQGSALSSVLNYPLFFPLRRAFAAPEASMLELTDIILRIQHEAIDATTLTTFLDNHDLPRFAHETQDEALRMNALAYPFLGDGIPIMYSGTEQGFTGGDDPMNREPLWQSHFDTSSRIYSFVSRLNAARLLALQVSADYSTTPTVPLVTTDHDIVLYRYPLISVLTNRGSNQIADRTLAFTVPGLKAGDILVNVAKLGSLDHADKYLSVGIGGSVRATIRKGQPLVYIPQKYIEKYGQILVGQAQARLRMESRLPVVPKVVPQPAGPPRRPSGFSSKASAFTTWVTGKRGPNARTLSVDKASYQASRDSL